MQSRGGQHLLQMSPDSHFSDFTAASDFESFLSRFEHLLSHWNLVPVHRNVQCLTREQLSSGSWRRTSETLRFSRVTLLVQHLCLSVPETAQSENGSTDQFLPVPLQDTSSAAGDFVLRCPPIVRLYGLRQFVLISSADKGQPIATCDRTKLLISAAAVALANSGCEVPAFVQVDSNGRQFVGVSTDPDTRTSYEMVRLNQVPANLRCLSGLLNVWKEKLGYPSTDCLTTRVSVRFVSVIKRYVHF